VGSEQSFDEGGNPARQALPEVKWLQHLPMLTISSRNIFKSLFFKAPRT
jgi:hypothetical protein